MSDPIFWLGLSVGLVAASLVTVLIALLPAVSELQRAARSVEKNWQIRYPETYPPP